MLTTEECKRALDSGGLSEKAERVISNILKEREQYFELCHEGSSTSDYPEVINTDIKKKWFELKVLDSNRFTAFEEVNSQEVFKLDSKFPSLERKIKKELSLEKIAVWADFSSTLSPEDKVRIYYDYFCGKAPQTLMKFIADKERLLRNYSSIAEIRGIIKESGSKKVPTKKTVLGWLAKANSKAEIEEEINKYIKHQKH